MENEEPLNEAETQPVDPQRFVEVVTQSINLAESLDEAQLTEIKQQVLDDYRLDKESMSDWFEKMERGIDLAKLVKADKNYPFKSAANVKYPLVTSAALQFNARAYPAIVPADAVVKCQTFGKDEQGLKAARSERVAGYMSWQLLNQIEEWEEDTDSLLVQLPIVGTMVRKIWYDSALGRARCRLLSAGAFIVNEKVKNLSDAPRMSEELPLYPSEIKQRENMGHFTAIEYDEDTEDKQAAHDFIEQHCLLDLDEDGLAEPYIVTVHVKMEKVVRIVADFDEDDVVFDTEEQMQPVQMPAQDFIGNVVMQEAMQPMQVVTGIKAIKRNSYFIAYKFMPGLDGGFHGTGLGLLLGDISDSINTILNMLLDAGHMSSLGGGFIGSDFKLKGASSRFKPGEWKQVNATGGAIRDSIVPMAFPTPDGVLFQMLGMLIDAGREISSTKDIMTGDNGGKVQTATTTIALIEQGMMVFSAAYKRIFRSLKREYKLLGRINAQSLDPQQYTAFHDEMGQDGQPMQFDPQQDFGAADMDIAPTADPRSVTKMQEMAKADLISQLAQQGLVNPQAAGQRVLDAAEIPDTEELALPPPDPMMQQMEQMQAQMGMQMMQADLAQKMVDIDLTIAKVESERAKATKDLADAELTGAKQKFDALLALLKERRDELEQTLKSGLDGMAGVPSNRGGQGGNAGNAGPPAGGSNAGLLGGQPMVGGSASSLAGLSPMA